MKIIEIFNPRNSVLIGELFDIWHESVLATHHFLSKNDVAQISTMVAGACEDVEVLLIAKNDMGKTIGFAGIEGHKLEMLFVHPLYFKQGAGRHLVQTAINNYSVTEVDVNEQNPPAKAFYEKMGFSVYDRDELDGQGNPFPILHMRLK